jgi:hypothetical protein
MTRITYTMKMILGWVCFHLWMATREHLFNNGPRWLYDWLLSWGGFYAYSMGYEHYREMMG